MSLAFKKSIPDISFDEALNDFKEFLSGQGLSNQLTWIFLEDVIFRGENIFIKTPVSNQSIARSYYKIGQKRNFGINLQAFCTLESQLCSYIYLPENDIDAQYSLMSNKALKYSVSKNLRAAKSITNTLKWKMLKLLSPELSSSDFDQHIPSKLSFLPKFSINAKMI